MLDALERLALRARRRRSLQLTVVLLRLFLAFAFVPSGLKKVLGEPFTDPTNAGPFHDFLHAFHGTGAFYAFVGAVQLLSASLLFSQRYAPLGATLAFPILTAILVFCWATWVPFTASVVTLMWLGMLGLVLWDVQRWRGLCVASGRSATLTIEAEPPRVDLGLWGRTGLAIMAIYLGVCAVTGEIYRPRGAELDNPAFWVFPGLLALVIATWRVDRARSRRGAGRGVSSH